MKYNITYLISVHPEPAGLEKSQIPPGCGGAQGLLVVSVIWSDDGTQSIKFTSKDGRSDTDLPPEEWWRIWCTLSAYLRDLKGLDHDKRDFCDTIFGVIQERYIEKDPGKNGSKGGGGLISIHGPN